MKSALDIARHLAENGMPLFVARPVLDANGEWVPDGGASGTGYHLPTGWPQLAKPDPAVVDQWKPGMALCAVTGHSVDVLDVDPRNGGAESLATLVTDGSMPHSYGQQSTPSGGTHDLIAPLGVRRQSGVLPGVDVQAGVDGKGRGFIFLAPTVKLSKATGELAAYAWTTTPDLTEVGPGDDSGLPVRALVEARRGVGDDGERPPVDTSKPPSATQTVDARNRLDRAVVVVEEAAEGTRNSTLISVLPTLHRYALGGVLGRDQVEEAIWQAARQAGVDRAEFEGVNRNAVAYAETDGPDRPDEVFDDSGRDRMAALFDSTPTLQKIRTAAHSRMLSAPVVLANTLARVLLAADPGWKLPPVIGSVGSLNLGFAIVGASSAGKSSSLSASADVLGTANSMQEDWLHPVGSGEGMIDAFYGITERTENGKKTRKLELVEEVERRALFTADEIETLRKLFDRSGSTLGPFLRTALTGGTLGTTNAKTGDTNRGRNRRVPGLSYRLAFTASVQPALSGALLDGENSGLPQRFLWVRAVDTTFPERVEDVPEWPGDLHWKWPGRGRVIDYPEHIKAEIRANRMAEQNDPNADVGRGHLMLTRLKVAAALAFLHEEDRITDQWWDLSGVLIEESEATRAWCARVLAEEEAKAGRRRAVAAGRAEVVKAEVIEEDRASLERASGAIRRKLERDGGADGLPWRDVRLAVASGIRSEYADRARARLESAGVVRVEDSSRGARRGERIWLI